MIKRWFLSINTLGDINLSHVDEKPLSTALATFYLVYLVSFKMKNNFISEKIDSIYLLYALMEFILKW